MKLKYWVGACAAACLSASATTAAPAEPTPGTEPWKELRETFRMPPAVDTGRVDVGDVDLYYAVYGQGDPVILLHPGLANGDYWASQIGPLSQEFQVIVVDLRGHGRSGWSDTPLTYPQLAKDVVRLIKTLNLKQPAVVGWGDGATVGLEIAMHYPKRIGEFVAFGMAYDKSGLQASPGYNPTFAEYVRKAIADHDRLAPGRPFPELLKQMDGLWAQGPSYSPADLAKLKTPTTIFVAQYDEWVKPEHMQEAGRLIPGAQVVTIPESSHFAPWQTPKTFNDALKVVLKY